MNDTPQKNTPLKSEQLRSIIMAAVESMPNASAPDLADWTISHQLTLVKGFYREWALEKLTALYGIELRRQRPMKRGRPSITHPQQSRLPGFEHIPYRMFLEFGGTRANPGKRVFLPDATVEDLKTRRALIRGQFTAENRELNELIAIMEPYDRAQPGITVKAALKLRAASRRAPDKTA